MLVALAGLGGDDRSDPMAIFVTLALLSGALLILAGVVALVRKWYKGTRQDIVSSAELLTQFRSLKDEGKLSPEEFQKIQAKLGRRTSIVAKKTNPADRGAGDEGSPSKAPMKPRELSTNDDQTERRDETDDAE
jgi:hypothetical protein